MINIHKFIQRFSVPNWNLISWQSECCLLFLDYGLQIFVYIYCTINTSKIYRFVESKCHHCDFTAQSAFHICEFIYNLRLRPISTSISLSSLHFLVIVRIELKFRQKTLISLNVLENWFRWTAQKNGMDVKDWNFKWFLEKKKYFSLAV